MDLASRRLVRCAKLAMVNVVSPKRWVNRRTRIAALLPRCCPTSGGTTSRRSTLLIYLTYVERNNRLASVAPSLRASENFQGRADSGGPCRRAPPWPHGRPSAEAHRG